jgi:hypothetical protein
MTMRNFAVGLAGAIVLGFGAIAAQPAQAQGFSITIGNPGYYAPPPVYRPYPRYRPVYSRPVRAYRSYGAYGAYGAPYAPAYYGPRCTTRVTRYWDGWAWVSRERRVCD